MHQDEEDYFLSRSGAKVLGESSNPGNATEQAHQSAPSHPTSPGNATTPTSTNITASPTNAAATPSETVPGLGGPTSTAPPPLAYTLADLMSEAQFLQMFPHLNWHTNTAPAVFDSTVTDAATSPLPPPPLYSYAALVEAATHFPTFANEGPVELRKREVGGAD